MPALIRCLFYGLPLLLLACSEEQGMSDAEKTTFQATEGFTRKDVFNASIFLPNYFQNLTPADQESFYRFAAPSKDEFVEIYKTPKSTSEKHSLDDFAQGRVNQFKQQVELRLVFGLQAMEVNQVQTLTYACDVVKPGATHEWSYWMIFAEYGSDFYEVRTWTRGDRKIRFEEKANIILHSLSFVESVQ